MACFSRIPVVPVIPPHADRQERVADAYARWVAAVGVIDESSPEAGDDQVVYTVALVIVDDIDETRVRDALVATLNRRRPMHWESEGSVVKQRFVDELCRLPVTAHVCASIVSRHDQQAARAALLDERLLERAIAADAGRLVIEQRSSDENDRDRQQIRSWFRDRREQFAGIEHVAKAEPLAWMPDTIAGIWSDALLGRGDEFIGQLVAAGVLRSMSRE